MRLAGHRPHQRSTPVLTHLEDMVPAGVLSSRAQQDRDAGIQILGASSHQLSQAGCHHCLVLTSIPGVEEGGGVTREQDRARGRLTSG